MLLTVLLTATILVGAVQPAAAGTVSTEAFQSDTHQTTVGDTPTPPATADRSAPPDTADGYLTAFRQLDDSPALSAYGAMDVLRSRAVAAVQVGEFTDPKRERMTRVLSVMQTFVTAYEASQNGSRSQSLRLANQTATEIDALRAAGGSDYAALAQLAIDRFYRAQGDQFRERARNASRTPEQIQLLEVAVRAYQRGGATERFSSTTTNLERLRAEYDKDLPRLNSSLSSGAAFREQCDGQCSEPQTALSTFGTGVFEQYVAARAAVADSRRAGELAREHGLSQRETTATEQVAWAEDALQSLTLAALALLLAYAALFALVGGYLMASVSQWETDTIDANLGEMLPREPLEVIDG